jgi:hypothetical protein
MQITEEEQKTDGATGADRLTDGRKKESQHQERGINAAVRDLGIDCTEAQRSIKIAATLRLLRIARA